MSPEQKEGWAATVQSDLYAAGLVCFYMLTGQRSLGLELPSEIDDSLWLGWDDFIRTALKTKPEQRFEDAGRMYAALNRVKAGGSPLSGIAPTSAGTEKKSANNKS